MFVPRNIDKRAKDLEIIQAKMLTQFNAFVKDFQNKLSLLKDKIYTDPKEQYFINLIKDCQIKLDQAEYPFTMFLFQDNNYMFNYNWQDNFFSCHCYKVLSDFESKFNITNHFSRQFIKDMLEKHF